MRLLVTRPKDDGVVLAAKLADLGHESILAPLFDIIYGDTLYIYDDTLYRGTQHSGAGHNTILPPADRVGALAFTSVNGVRALVDYLATRATGATGATGFDSYSHLPVFAVGAITARAARQAGWGDVQHAEGDVDALVRTITAAAPLVNLANPVLHIVGRDRAGDLVAGLTAGGIAAVSAVLYRAEAITAWPQDIADILAADEFDDKKIDGVLLYSQRAARVFIELSRDMAYGPTAYCLSLAIADIMCAADYPTLVAQRAEEDSLIDLLR